jgi:hypothetical protein
MEAIGSLAIPVLRYSFGIINWHQADIDHFYVPRKDRGRGLMQIEGAYITEVIKFEEYVEHTEDPLMQIVRTHPTQHKLNTVPHSHQTPEKSSVRHKANKNHNILEPEGKVGSKTTAWTVSK